MTKRESNTLAVLGCGMVFLVSLLDLANRLLGALGTAILSGILASMADQTADDSGRLFTNFTACVRRKETGAAVSDKISSHANANKVEILNKENLRGVKQADAVLLACQTHLYKALFDEPGMREALKKKLIISVLAGVTTAQLEAALGNGEDYFVIRAMPNIACFVRDSATVIEKPQRTFPEALLHVTDTVFKAVGNVFYIQPSAYDICTALCGSSPAFLAVFIDSMVDGAVAMGLSHKDAVDMAACTMRGAASLVLESGNPWTIRHQVASPGGSTMQGLLALEQGNVRSTISNALMVAAKEAKKLGSKENA
uniref:Delta-1-pyrroline-5-carboxylate reductase kk1I n=1 Tax=Curvularia clavata TaxID=95742 RepID=KK1I_CURCL|nr:RecName: Full=Pyrroline-5-carboxylate reductase-like protein TR08; AltName: Full=KK-1 biosynthesis cluster protein TR08; Flags: Precursor [Curvularia clavata]BBC83964.1 pyrroline-5-carboxylate reductase-like protein [Curvularia clavata]